MARTRVSTVIHQFTILLFFLVTSTTSFLNSETEFGFEINYDDQLTGSFNYAYKLDRVKIVTNLLIAHNTLTPDIKVFPIYNKQSKYETSIATLEAVAGNSALGGLLLVYKKELQNRKAQQYEESHLQNCLHEVERGKNLFAQVGIHVHE